MSREQELQSLLAEIEKLKGSKSLRGKPLGEYQIIEQAAARVGMYPSYAYRLIYPQKFPQTIIERKDCA